MASYELASAARVQGRVIWALILREVKGRYEGTKLGYGWALIDPLIQLAGWLAVLILIRNKNTGIGDSLITFIATGLLPYKMFSSVASYVSAAFRQNRSLLTYPIVTPIDIMAARWVLESATIVTVTIIILTVLVLIGESAPPDRISGLVAASCLLLLLGFAMGLFNAVVIRLFEFYEYIWDVLSRIIWFTCGIFFLIENLPLILQHYLWYNPVAHGVQMFRDAWYVEFRSTFPYPPYMVLWIVMLLFVGLFLERRVRGRPAFER